MSNERGRTSSNFRKPPVEYQFKKGQSGHPQGRPPKKRGGIDDRFIAMALDEAMRTITVREGDRVSKMPALQAVIRTMFRAAGQGDVRAGRLLLGVMARAESERVAETMKIVEWATRYKEKNLEALERIERAGREPPEIYPHPDDFLIDEAKGEIIIDGPKSKEEAGAREAVRQHALQSMPRYFEVEKALKKNPSNGVLRQEFRELKEYFDFLKGDAARNLRLEALRRARRAHQAKTAEPEDDNEDEA